MKKKLNVFVYCKVYSKELEHLLHFQEKVLCEFAKDNDMEIIGVIRDFSPHEDLSSKHMRNLMDKMYEQIIDAVLFYDQSRITPFNHLYTEFELFAHECEVYLIPFKKIFDEKTQ
ncbi:MAG: hypothetical protein IJ359_09060 [Erysipelotrichaceae bacterium]|nr:hypothetical protein [Erysipelotrichaceae bacterium]